MERVKVIAMLLLFVILFHFTDCVPDNRRRQCNVAQCLGRRQVVQCRFDSARHDERIEPDPDPQCSILECLSIVGCRPRNTTLSEFLKKVKVNVTSMRRLDLIIPALSAEDLVELPLEELSLTQDGYSTLKTYFGVELPYLSPAAGFLNPLPKLRNVTFTYVELPPMPLHSEVEHATFSYGKSTGAFGGCQELRSLELDRWEVQEDRWLANCTKLTNLTILNTSIPCQKKTTLEGSDDKGIQVKRMLGGASHLKHLRLNYCHFFDRSGVMPADFLGLVYFTYQHSLDTLNLTNNGIRFMYSTADVKLRKLPNFVRYYTDVSHIIRNISQDFEEVYLTIKSNGTLPNLRILDMSGNEEYNICKEFVRENNIIIDANYTFSIVHPNLRRLILDRTNSTIECITKERLPKLEYLSLVGNKFAKFFLQDVLEITWPLTITFGSSSVASVTFTESTYARIYNRSKTDTNKLQLRVVNMTSLDCDCANGYFIRALREGVFDGEFVTCEGDEEQYRELLQRNIKAQVAQQIILNQTDMSKLECDKYNCPPCDCRRSWSDSSVTVNCTRSNIREMPRFPNETVRRLEAAHNEITNLSEHDFPSSLEFADLSSNNIAHISKETTSSIFSKKIHLRLSGNPIACDCDNYYFLESLQKHSDQVEDYAYLTCLNDGVQFLSNVDVGELCQKIRVIQASLVGGAAVLVLAIAALVIQHRYSRSIKIFVHARGWCGWCVKEDMIDADKLYDVFVTFCHKDAAVVIDEVLPKLESLGYRTCVHIRDWTPGEFIPNQITRSVEASRRTMVFLSQNFLESMWAMEEFRTALSQAIVDGIPRVIMVLLHEIDDTAVQPDLRSFLRSNTYVQWGDPWFWDKIQYALPSRRAATQTSEAGVEVIEVHGNNCDNVQSANDV